jgi:ABC-type Mn2+/Zn2+ transport system permease subunit
MAFVLIGVVVVYLLILRPALRFFPRLVSAIAAGLVVACSIELAREVTGVDPDLVIIVVAVLAAPVLIAESGRASGLETPTPRDQSQVDPPRLPRDADSID